ncbi:MAG: O-antigen ligase family protein [Candidatus Sumerlaeia bacterium]
MMSSSSPKHPIQIATQGPARWLFWMWRLAWVCLVALAATPVIFDPVAQDDPFMTPKWAWIAIFTALGTAAILARAFAGRPAMIPLRLGWLLALIFCLWHWIAISWAPSPSMGVDAALRVTWMTLALWLGLQLVKSRRRLLWLGWWLIAAGCVSAVWALTEDVVRAWFPSRVWIRPNLPDWRGFLSGGLGNTNHIGDLLALAMIPALIFYGESRRRGALWVSGFALILLPAALISVFSAGSSLGLVIGAAVMLILVLIHAGPRWFARRWRRWAVLILGWALVIGFFTTDHPLNPHRPNILREGFGSGRWQEGGPTRLAIWAETLEMIRLHPVFGAGTGNFTYVFPEMDSALIWDDPNLRAYQGRWTNAAHNIFMQAWAELGMIGLATLIALLATLYFVLLKNLDRARRTGLMIRVALAGLLTAWIVQSQVNFLLQTPVGMLCFYAMILAVLVEKGDRGDPKMPPYRFETDHFAIRVDWRNMRRPTGLGIAALLPNWLAIGAGALFILGVIACIPKAIAPVRAQREYHRGVIAPTPELAEQHFLEGLAIDPDAQDLRSHYSEWLVKQGRGEDALKQLAIVRKRLNSWELFDREARAYALLGQTDKAKQSIEQLKKRFWSYRAQSE